MKRFAFMLIALFLTAGLASAETVDFEDLNVPQIGYWYGSDYSGGFESKGVEFNNNYNVYTYDDVTYESWDGFAYSNLTDTEERGQNAQFNVITGSGVKGSAIYAVGYWSDFGGTFPTITLDSEQIITGAYFTNNNYAYYIMKEGDETFGTEPYDQNDYLKLIITGYDRNGLEKDQQVEVFLAQDGSILNDWKWVDLSVLGPVKEIQFSMDSTDKTVTENDEFMNTPSYFAMDNFNGTAPSIDDDGGSDSSTCFINTASNGLFTGNVK